jgi:PAS domain S-box-containing protein
VCAPKRSVGTAFESARHRPARPSAARRHERGAGGYREEYVERDLEGVDRRGRRIRKLGFTAEELSRMTLSDVMPGIGMDDLRALVTPLIARTQQEIVFEVPLRTAAGTEFPAEFCVQYFADEMPPILVAMVHDISDRMRLKPATS